MARLTLALAAVALLTSSAFAQHAQSYAGLQLRSVKALSNEQVADLRAGRGMGLALAAELNGYPGPSHVIELADPLALTASQRERAQALFAAMKAETMPLGEALIAAETDLDRQFAARSVTPATLSAATDAIGAAQGRLRGAHLKYHLAMLKALTPEQIKRYGELRGYANAAPAGHTPGMHHRMK
ncbi:MAG TPA: periplasmic heavy metal sensor [Pseudolabrys sp.]|nr:periplasmic heavy metal sensor [Pseudolabrys sp.]